MEIKQLYTNCLAEAAYYIESEGEAVIIDPIREIKQYLQLAAERGATIKYVFETHFHADFVSGHIDLARETGAKIVFGPGADTDYNAYKAKDGEIFSVGKVKIKVLHTPGHTPESTCYLLYDESGKENAIFTGDTLFVGDVGRPDLLDGKMTSEELAGMLYDSLNNKIKPLPDEVLLYPAHGPGSQCGKNLGSETWSTLGEQKRTNYALKDMTKEEFIKQITEGLTPPPQYFFKDAAINKAGYLNIDEVLKKNLNPLDLKEFVNHIENGAHILDTRIPDQFEKGFIPGSLNIGLNGQFAIWTGTLIDINKPLVLISEPGKEEEAITRLARVGYENVSGYLNGGINTWLNAGKEIDKIDSYTAEEFAEKVKAGEGEVLDVRRRTEVEKGHVSGAINAPLSELSEHLLKMDKSKSYLVHCAGGYRSMIAASIMKAKGIKNVANIKGGFGAIKNTSLAIEQGNKEVNYV